MSSINTAEYDELITILKEARESKGVSIRELCRRLDQFDSYIGKIERKDRRIDVKEFCDLCEALGIDPAELFGAYLSRLKSMKLSG